MFESNFPVDRVSLLLLHAVERVQARGERSVAEREGRAVPRHRGSRLPRRRSTRRNRARDAPSLASSSGSCSRAMPPARSHRRFQQAVPATRRSSTTSSTSRPGNAINHGSLGATHDAAYNGTIAARHRHAGRRRRGQLQRQRRLSGVARRRPASVLGNPTFTAEAIVLVPPSAASATDLRPLPPLGTLSDLAPRKSVYFSFSNSEPTELFVGFYSGGLRSPTGSLALGRWHHVVWVRTGRRRRQRRIESLHRRRQPHRVAGRTIRISAATPRRPRSRPASSASTARATSHASSSARSTRWRSTTAR